MTKLMPLTNHSILHIMPQYSGFMLTTVLSHLLDVELIRVCCSMSQQLLSISGQDIELGDDIKEAAPHALGSGNVVVQLILAP